MAKATDRAKAGHVTVSTVRGRAEAHAVGKAARSGGHRVRACGRTADGARRRRPVPLRGIKVQVDRSVAKRAIELLREQHGELKPAANNMSGALSWFQLPAAGWLRTALEVGVILAAATILAVVFFLY